jgi:hypothetical protein
MKPFNNMRVSLVGVLTPCSWSGDGRPDQIALQTIDEEEYRIHPCAKASGMLAFLQCMVEVEGRIVAGDDGGMAIKVDAWRKIHQLEWNGTASALRD